MIRVLFLSFVTSLLLFSAQLEAATSRISGAPLPGAAWISTPDEATIDRADAIELTNLSLRDLSDQVGRKLTFSEKAAFVYAKHKVKRELRRNKDAATVKAPGNSEGFGIGFLLGFFLGLIGVLIVYLAVRKNKPGAVKGAWVGLGVVVLLTIILTVIAGSQTT